MDRTWVLIDTNTGLHVGWYFWLRVLDEVNRATRYGAPFGLLLLEAEEAGTARAKRSSADPISLIPPAIRSTDLGGFIAPGRAAVLLTHQDAESAEQARDRILERMGANDVEIRWQSRLLTFPDHAAEISRLLTTGGEEEADRSARLPA
jgi:hypothetical protein